MHHANRAFCLETRQSHILSSEELAQTHVAKWFSLDEGIPGVQNLMTECLMVYIYVKLQLYMYLLASACRVP